MADTRSYEADVARVLRDYYAQELQTADAPRVAEVAARVAAEVLTGATFYVDGSYIDATVEDKVDETAAQEWQDGRAEGWGDGNSVISYIRDGVSAAWTESLERRRSAQLELDKVLDKLEPALAQEIQTLFDDAAMSSAFDDMLADEATWTIDP